MQFYFLRTLRGMAEGTLSAFLHAKTQTHFQQNLSSIVQNEFSDRYATKALPLVDIM